MIGEHSPTTAARQALVALEEALRQYEQIGPSKMDQGNLNIIRDAANKLVAGQVDEAWNAGARAMRENIATLLSSYGDKDEADAIRSIPLPRRPA